MPVLSAGHREASLSYNMCRPNEQGLERRDSTCAVISLSCSFLFCLELLIAMNQISHQRVLLCNIYIKKRGKRRKETHFHEDGFCVPAQANTECGGRTKFNTAVAVFQLFLFSSLSVLYFGRNTLGGVSSEKLLRLLFI